MNIGISLILVIITCLISIPAFSQPKMIDDLVFYPPAIKRKQYYRFISHGFIHADAIHLGFNMIALWSFGKGLEDVFKFPCVFGKMGIFYFLLLYFTGMIVASIPDYFKYKDSYHFKSLGASGAVSAIVFSTIVFFPQSPVALIFIPGIKVAGYIFAILYMAISVYLDKRGGGNVNHSAHFWGAAYGVVFTLVWCQLFASDFDVYGNFMAQLKTSTDDPVLFCGY